MPVMHIVIPDGEDEINVHLRKCKCGCGGIFTPATPGQLFLEAGHERKWRNDQRERKTPRRHKSRPA